MRVSRFRSQIMKPLPHCFGLRLLLALAAACSFSSLAGITYYSHDVSGRITVASSESGNTDAYTYDLAGNLLGHTVAAPGSAVGTEDSDHDGLPDGWEQQYFNTLSRDGTGDYDGDGLTDLAEFLLGTDPTDPYSGLRIIPPPLMDANGVTVTWTSVPGKTYRLQYQNALGSGAWINVPGDVPATASTAQKLDSSARGQDGRFYRVQLVLNAGTGETPPAPELLPNPLIDSNGVTVRWSSVSGARYRLQFKDSLGDATWQDVTGDVVTNSGIGAKTDATSGGHKQRFYRVVLLVP